MKSIERRLHAADQFQQRHPVLAFPVAVWSKFNDDQAGNLAALISYYAYAALFPLLLILVTVLNIVLKSNPSLRDSLLESAFSQYPVIGPHIKASLGAIPGTGLPLFVGIVFLLFGLRERVVQRGAVEFVGEVGGKAPEFGLGRHDVTFYRSSR